MTNKSHLKIMYVLFVASFLLFSCDSSGTSSVKKDTYHEGKEGITIRFYQASPPKTVYPDDEFNILIFLENKGAFDLAQKRDDTGNILIDDYGVLTITSNPFYLEQTYTDPQQTRIYLNGKSQFYPSGDGDAQEYGFYVKDIKGQRENPKTPLLFTLCYPYRTELSQDVCIDMDYYNMDVRKKVCKIQDISLSKGQGAPVAITKISPRAIKHDNDVIVEFLLTIENVGKGAVLTRTDDEIENQCTTIRDQNYAWNNIQIHANLLGKELYCQGGNVRLVDNKAEVKCSTAQYSTQGTTQGTTPTPSGTTAPAGTVPANIVQRVNSYQNSISQWSARWGVEEAIVKAVITQESSGNPNAGSVVGARGLMQIMSDLHYATCQAQCGFTSKNDYWNSDKNICCGTYILSRLSTAPRTYPACGTAPARTYVGTEATLRGYNGWGCSATADPYFVENVMRHYPSYVGHIPTTIPGTSIPTSIIYDPLDTTVWQIYDELYGEDGTVIRSSIAVGTARNFVSVLYVTLDYLYQESASKEIDITRFDV